MAHLEIPIFSDKSALYDWLITNKAALSSQKKADMKKADAFSYQLMYFVQGKEDAVKVDPAGVVSADATRIKVRAIINTTKFYDSHGDVHIDQLWNKSLKESKEMYLVKEHNFSFNGIISDNVKAFTKQMTWAELGFTYEGQTQALVFDATLDKEGSPKLDNGYTMFDMYRMGKVKNHSVGMRYVEMDLAINDSRYEKEFAIWEKYIDLIVNKEEVIPVGYFWAVTQAKVIEGSAVVRGANRVTPTQSVTQIKTEPEKSTHEQPEKSIVDFKELAKAYQPINYI